MGDLLLPLDLGTVDNTEFGLPLTAVAISAFTHFACAILVRCGGQRREGESILTCFNLRESCFLVSCARGGIGNPV